MSLLKKMDSVMSKIFQIMNKINKFLNQMAEFSSSPDYDKKKTAISNHTLRFLKRSGNFIVRCISNPIHMMMLEI